MPKKDSKNKLDLTTISGVACKILLILYKNQLEDIERIENLNIDFCSNPITGKTIKDSTANKEAVAASIIKITNNVSLLISAFYYLADKDFIDFTRFGEMSGDYSFYKFRLLAKGEDIIENAKNNPLLGPKEFRKTFNINVSFNIDSFIKNSML